MQSRFGKKEFSFFPQSFILPQDAKLLRKAWESNGRQKWIEKPVSGPQWAVDDGLRWRKQSLGPSTNLVFCAIAACISARHWHSGHSQVESAPQAQAPAGTEVSPPPACVALSVLVSAVSRSPNYNVLLPLDLPAKALP
jgi:hypothetical protein